MELHVSEDQGLTWRTTKTTAPELRSGYVEMARTSEGALILRDQVYDDGDTTVRMVLWRLEPGDDAWVKVHDTGKLSEAIDTGYTRQLTFAGDRVMSGTLHSDDDGRTWTGVDRWR